MGGFINSQSDAEICEVLNKRFSDEVNTSGETYLNELRDFFKTEKLFDIHHHLHRVFHRLAISVTGGPSVPTNPNSRLRWFHLLKGGGSLPKAVSDAIRSQLTLILGDDGNPASAVDYVTFSTVHAETLTKAQFELFDNTDYTKLTSVNQLTPTPQYDSNGKSYCALILRCNIDKALDDAPGEHDPPDSDGNVETGPIPFFKPKRAKKSTANPVAKKSAKKAAKKASKKAAKKAGKKAAKKAGKK
jgi:hypothetical protein